MHCVNIAPPRRRTCTQCTPGTGNLLAGANTQRVLRLRRRLGRPLEAARLKVPPSAAVSEVMEISLCWPWPVKRRGSRRPVGPRAARPATFLYCALEKSRRPVVRGAGELPLAGGRETVRSESDSRRLPGRRTVTVCDSGTTAACSERGLTGRNLTDCRRDGTHHRLQSAPDSLWACERTAAAIFRH